MSGDLCLEQFDFQFRVFGVPSVPRVNYLFSKNHFDSFTDREPLLKNSVSARTLPTNFFLSSQKTKPDRIN